MDWTNVIAVDNRTYLVEERASVVFVLAEELVRTVVLATSSERPFPFEGFRNHPRESNENNKEISDNDYLPIAKKFTIVELTIDNIIEFKMIRNHASKRIHSKVANNNNVIMFDNHLAE